MTEQDWRLAEGAAPRRRDDDLSPEEAIRRGRGHKPSTTEGEREEIARLQNRVVELRKLLEAHTSKEVWVWEQYGENDLASLTCAILINADTLRALLAQSQDGHAANG